MHACTKCGRALTYEGRMFSPRCRACWLDWLRARHRATRDPTKRAAIEEIAASVVAEAAEQEAANAATHPND